MSQKLVELAADLASFNNTSIDDALLALRSGLSGETEPLKRYGIALSDARMRQELMAQGITDLGATLTPLQKTQAAYTLILKDSTLAQGDFARTSEGLANTTRTLAAEQENLRAKVGEKAIPVAIAWDKANLQLLESINAVGTLVDKESHSVLENADAVRALMNIYPGLGDAIFGNTEAMMEAEQAADDLESAHIALRTNALKPASSAVDDLERHLADLGREADTARDEIDGLAETITDELFGDAINAGNEAAMKRQIADLIEQRKEAKKGSLEYIELTGEIAETRKALFDYHLTQAAAEGPEAAIRFLQRERAAAGAAKGEIDKLIQRYRILAGLQQVVAPIIRLTTGLYSGKALPTPYAHGGRYEAGVPRLVGEGGPELDIPDHSGVIYPDVMAGASGWSGQPGSSTVNQGGVTIETLAVDARGATNPAAVGSAVRQGVHDAMADVLRQQTARLPTGTRS